MGPNILVVRDAHGGLFGGFAAEPWRPETGAYGFGSEAFVFVCRRLGPNPGGGEGRRGEGEEGGGMRRSGNMCFWFK